MTDPEKTNDEAFVERLPADVGHNLRHFGPARLHYLGGGGCGCEPEQVPHEPGGSAGARPVVSPGLVGLSFEEGQR